MIVIKLFIVLIFVFALAQVAPAAEPQSLEEAKKLEAQRIENAKQAAKSVKTARSAGNATLVCKDMEKAYIKAYEPGDGLQGSLRASGASSDFYKLYPDCKPKPVKPPMPQVKSQ